MTRRWLALVAPVLLVAQSERGGISGVVTDSSGGVVPEAKVTVTNLATSVPATTTTTAAGAYTAASLPAGVYSVRVEKEGFKPAVRSGITLNAAANARLDLSLEIGTAFQVVEVTGDVQQMQTESAKVSSTIANKLVDALPLVVGGSLRNPFDLAQLTPEVKNFGNTAFLVGGGQAASFGITLDGVSAANTRALATQEIATNSPSLEAITEFTVDSGGFKAEYGHATGGVLTFSSKSGSNDFHGSLYEFLRNDKLDARRFFEAQRGVYKQHDFGASAGGPVHRNKTFFFASYEGFRNRFGAASVARSVPTPEMYEGDFSQWVNSTGGLIPIYDPGSLTTDAAGRRVRARFAGNQIPKARFDPLAQKLLGVYGPLRPNNGAAPGTNDYVRSNYLVTQGSEVSPVDKFSVKGDHVLSQNDRLSGYYGRNRSDRNPGPGGFPSLPGLRNDVTSLEGLSVVYRLSWDHVFRPTLLNHFYAGTNIARGTFTGPNARLGNWKDKFCYPNVPDCDRNLFLLFFSEFSGWGSPPTSGSDNNIYALHDDLSWIRGRHSFKIGGMYQISHYNGFAAANPGQATFRFTGTGVPGDTNFTTAGGNSFASFLLGHVDGANIATERFTSQQWRYFAGYFQDDYRVNHRLTLNLGIRWETTLPPVEAEDRFSDFSPTLSNPAADGLPGALIFAGAGPGREGSRTLADSYFKAFGPRVGLAFSLDSKTVVRAAYSRSFGAVTTVSGSTHFRGFVQGLAFANLTQGVEPTFRFQDGMPFWAMPPFIDPAAANGDTIPWWQGREATRPPENNAWTLSLQRQLTPSLLLEAAYNGLAGSHLQAGLLNYNQVDPRFLERYGSALLISNINSPQAVAAGIRKPYASFNSTVAQALRPFPQYTGIDTRAGGGDHSGHSSYHAAVVRAERRYSAGLIFQTSYVLSKIVTDADSYWSVNFAPAMDHYNRRLEKSIGFFDLTHNIKLGLVYELPFGKRAWWGGWRLSSTHYYASGAPVFVGTSISLPLSVPPGRTAPTITTYEGWRGPPARETFDPQTDRFFQPASFFGPQPNTRFGNATRANPRLREFPNYNENLSIAKSFPLRDKLRLDLRWEAFNLLNRVRFSTGPRILQDNNFGRLTSTSDLLNDPRRMQLAAKVYW